MSIASEAAFSPLLRFTGIRLVHTALRRDLAPLPGRIRALGTARPAAVTETLTHWRLIARVLTAHHAYEDADLWPVLRVCRPELRLLLNRLEADHHRIDHDVTVVTAMIGGLARDRERAWMAAAAAKALIETVDAHLRVEEVQVLPELARAVGPGEHLGTLGASLAALDEADVFVGRTPGDAITWLLDGIAGGVADCESTVGPQPA
jgi:hemerythrin HHE cation binding domain-containing protein